MAGTDSQPQTEQQQQEQQPPQEPQQQQDPPVDSGGSGGSAANPVIPAGNDGIIWGQYAFGGGATGGSSGLGAKLRVWRRGYECRKARLPLLLG